MPDEQDRPRSDIITVDDVRIVVQNEKIVALHTDGLQGLTLLGDVQLGTAAAVPQTPGVAADGKDGLKDEQHG